MVTTPRSENLPLQGIKFPRGWSSGVENGLNNLGWETWVYELGPLRGQAHSLHSSGWGWNIEPPAWDRRSLLTGSSRGPGELSPVLPGAERSEEMHTHKASAASVSSHPVREELDAWGRTRVGSETSLETQTDPLVPGQTSSISMEPPFPGPQYLSRQVVCSYIVDPRDVSCSQRQQLPLGPQEDLARQFAKWMWPQTPLVIYVEDHRCVVWADKHMVAPEIC